MKNENPVVTKAAVTRTADCPGSQLIVGGPTAAEIEAQAEKMKSLRREQNTPQPLGPGLGCVR